MEMTKILRTPDHYFSSLPNYLYKPNYVEDLQGIEGLRIHYLDEGPHNAEHTFLCLHGEPTWSYLYRKMIPVFMQAKGRVVAPDLIGFGKTDKPVDDGVYTFCFHRNMLLEFIKRLDLKNITLVCQDWGGLLGLTLPMEMPERFSRLIVMNTILATGDFELSPGFLAWRNLVKANPDLKISRLLGSACPHLSEAEKLAYDAPFPDVTYKAGVRKFPFLVCDNPNAEGAAISRAAKNWWQTQWTGKSFMSIGMKDPILIPSYMKKLHSSIRGCPPALEISEAGHFVQEWGEVVVRGALRSF